METPLHVSEKADNVLDHLNATWGLQLPRLYGNAAITAEADFNAIARRCSSRIRFLCDRSGNVLDSCIADFEQVAKTVFSDWVYKPSQEKETIPSLPTSSSFLSRDIANRSDLGLSAGLRDILVAKLANLLEDEYNLARDSEDYSRTSSQPGSNSSSRAASFATAEPLLLSNPPGLPQKSGKQVAAVQSMSNKRRKLSDEFQDHKRSRLQPQPTTIPKIDKSINDFFHVRKNEVPTFSYNVDGSATSNPRKSTAEVFTSFDTATSAGPSVLSSAEPRLSSSADTSILADAEESQDYFPTQDYQECLADKSFASALDLADSFHQAREFDLHDLDTTTPFTTRSKLPQNLVFWRRWEIYRVAQDTDLPVQTLYDATIGSQKASYSEFWNALVTNCKEHGKQIPPKSDIRSWMEETNSYESADGKTASFTCSLEYNRTSGPYLWRLLLHPIKIDKGCRIHRKFGADRHLVCFLNYLNALPAWVTQRRDYNAEESFEKIVTWLTVTKHHISGREWRAFYIEPGKSNTKCREGELPRLKLNMFAVDGLDFRTSTQFSKRNHVPIDIMNLVNWHIPLELNLSSTDVKLFSRFGLELSKTRQTIILQPEQFRHLCDVDPVMNDGCALMSIKLAQDIWAICGDGSNDVPSAFQGRISGAKGLWVVDYRTSEAEPGSQDIWIEVSDSQLKIKPHPRVRQDADEIQRSFEVVKWSSPCLPGHLNIQLINILVDRGVPRTVLRQVVLDDIEEYIRSSRAAMKDPPQLQAWLQEYHSRDRNERPIPFDDGLPEYKEDEVRFLSLSGFRPDNCDHLRQGMVDLMTQRLQTYVEKLRIQVPYSTSVFCVPDPYHILEEDEVHLAFSSHWENPRTGLKEIALNDIDVLVSRNPAALASDIQKRRAVYRHELRNFRDVIVFPTRGKVPLASLLSGGDYDGDTVTVIWEPALVDNFEGVEQPQLPDEKKCGLQKASHAVSSIVRSQPPSAHEVDEFLTQCMLFNAQQGRLGMCTAEHEQLVYSGARLSDPGCVLLATLAGYLVDAPKQGLSLSDASWSLIRTTAKNGRKLQPLAYKNGDNQPRRMVNGECVNIIDHLKFDVADKRKDSVLSEFEKMLSGAGKYDRDLTLLYKREYERGGGKADKLSINVSLVMDDLENQLKLVMDEWLRSQGKRKAKENDRSTWSTNVRRISSMIRDIKPIECNCDIYHDFVREDLRDNEPAAMPVKGTRWSLLRASTMYRKYYKCKITWWTVGDELCRIKARSLGATREVTPAMLHVLKADTKLIKRLAGESFQADDEMDE